MLNGSALSASTRSPPYLSADLSASTQGAVGAGLQTLRVPLSSAARFRGSSSNSNSNSSSSSSINANATWARPGFPVRVAIYVDHSIIEVFVGGIDDRPRAVVTARSYPVLEASDGVALWAAGASTCVITAFEGWELAF